MSLRAWRETNNVSQLKLAGRLNVKQPHISRVEADETACSLSLALRIYREIGIAIGPLSGKTKSEIGTLERASKIIGA